MTNTQLLSAIEMESQFCRGRKETNCSRINFVSHPDEFEWRSFKYGLVSVHVSWSGHSVGIGNSILNHFDVSKDKEIYILDIDIFKEVKHIELFVKICRGYFESVWIENGKVKFNYCYSKGEIGLEKLKSIINDSPYKAGNNISYTIAAQSQHANKATVHTSDPCNTLK